MRQVAAVITNMRRKHTCFSCQGAHFLHQFIGRPMIFAADILFVSEYLVPDETLDLFGEIPGFGTYFVIQIIILSLFRHPGSASGFLILALKPVRVVDTSCRDEIDYINAAI